VAKNIGKTDRWPFFSANLLLRVRIRIPNHFLRKNTEKIPKKHQKMPFLAVKIEKLSAKNIIFHIKNAIFMV
jgi:hypothetical protein